MFNNTKQILDGYVYVYNNKPDPVMWFNSPDDDWDIELYYPTGEEDWRGKIKINNVPCHVFLCPDGKVRASTNVKHEV